MKRNTLLLQPGMVEYGEAWELQKALLEARASDSIPDCLILLQHPPTFTFGRRYKEANLFSNRAYYEDHGFAVYKTDRGGLATYHGPGQAVGYPIIKMNTYTKDFHYYLRMLENVMIGTLSDMGIPAQRKDGYTGVWIRDAKIGFIGIRVAFGYTMHGFSLNINNDLKPFDYITPCGIEGITITSVRNITNSKIDMQEVYDILRYNYSNVFNVSLIPTKIEMVMQEIYLMENHRTNRYQHQTDET
ncbi:MAG: lipoyl(octanoyl) transferase LipB [Candidatus Loosdrechtia sp.]|uniref:lipoyl(octanoyl) transferase LipB n=1 Tax=Candidatus Loosdrechtia sp. TaxID=3101272 RepID=UPI003A69D50C|nr:MAG: lipoyl(octanoyl) transferase LipB [Candidatus Jettenia sp. AMX2]